MSKSMELLYGCTTSFILSILVCLSECSGENFYSFIVKDSQKQDVSLESYRGKVTLVVNVASQCGYTESTYRGLKKLHDILSYGDHFSVLAFPCNQFGDQEPYDIETIVEHISSEYDIEFPIFNKIDVIGEHADPTFKYLAENSSVIPEWNFYKYLVNGSGNVVGAWGTRTNIEEIFDEIQAEVQKVKKAAVIAAAGGKSSGMAVSGKDEL